MRTNPSHSIALLKDLLRSLLAALAVFAVPTMSEETYAETIEAFTEPYQRIAIPASEIGVIQSLFVEEGDIVTEQQLLGKLDDAVLRSSLEVAAAAMHASGPQLSAEAAHAMRQQQLTSYQALQNEGNATSRELAQAELELQQAAARLQTVREDHELRKLEFERVKRQIQQREITSPVNGIVIAIDRHVGEFVSPTDPTVLHIVQIDMLRAVFSVPRREAASLEPGQNVTLSIGIQEGTVDAVIEFVSPVANPESNTVQVKLRIPNAQHKCPSGVSCRWNLDAPRRVSKESQLSRNQRS